jgi:hypothetical protein
MKNLYPKIKFVYSLPYNRMLAEYEGKEFDEIQFRKEIQNYIKKLQPKWRKIEKSVFRALKEIVKNEWQEREIKCYVVKYCKYTGISDPLTLKMEPDLDYAFDALIHELAHIIACYDFEKYKKILEIVKERFPNENPKTIRHIYINFIELKALKKLFNREFVEKIIKRNLILKGLRRAWEIVLSQENNLTHLFQIADKK